MDRFREPRPSDDLATCQGCGKTFHYSDLSDNGFCEDCEPEENDE